MRGEAKVLAAEDEARFRTHFIPRTTDAGGRAVLLVRKITVGAELRDGTDAPQNPGGGV